MQKELLRLYPYIVGGYALLTVAGALYLAILGEITLAASFVCAATPWGLLSWGSFRFGDKHKIPQSWLRVATFFAALALVLFVTSVASN